MRTVKVTGAGALGFSCNRFVLHYRWLIYKLQAFLYSVYCTYTLVCKKVAVRHTLRTRQLDSRCTVFTICEMWS